MKLQSHAYASRREKVIDFIIGIVGWHVVNGLLLLFVFLPSMLSTGESSSGYLTGLLTLLSLCVSLLALVFNVSGLFYFVATRHWIGLGMLASWALYLLLGVLAGVVLGIVCFASLVR